MRKVLEGFAKRRGSSDLLYEIGRTRGAVIMRQIGESKQFEAVQSDDSKKSERTLDEEFPIDFFDELEWFGAAKSDDSKKIEEMLAKGFAVNLFDDMPWTALHHACARRNAAAVKVLLAGGANPNSVGTNGLRPIHLAAPCGEVEVLKDLLEAGAEIDALGEAKYSSLTLAIVNRKNEAVSFLINAGANRNVMDKSGKTPLHHAASISEDMVSELISAGASYDVEDGLGRTPLDYAIMKGKPACVSKLLSCGAFYDASSERVCAIEAESGAFGFRQVLSILEFWRMRGEVKAFKADGKSSAKRVKV